MLTNSPKQAVKVYLRIRPLLNGERAGGAGDAGFAVAERELTLVNPRHGVASTYTLDRVFAGEATQADVFQALEEDVLSGVMEGVNATIFAYGASNSGKTHTIGGRVCDESGDCWPGSANESSGSSPQHPLPESELEGVIPRAVRWVLSRATELEAQGMGRVTLRASFLEIYQERIYDLLVPSRLASLELREDRATGQIYAANLTWATIDSPKAFNARLAVAWQNRFVAATKVNEHSSRSHFIVQLDVARDMPADLPGQQQPDEQDEHLRSRSQSQQRERLVAKLLLVDLAGSENNKKTQNEAARMAESGAIHRSLLALAKVVESLSEGAAVFGGMRDSKLTRLLRDSLGGSARTCMIACVSPRRDDVPETINTLKYATRARNIKNHCRVHAVREGAAGGDAALLREIAELRYQLKVLREASDGRAEYDGLLRENARLTATVSAMDENRSAKEERGRSAYAALVGSVMESLKEDQEMRVVQCEWERLLRGTRSLRQRIAAAAI